MDVDVVAGLQAQLNHERRNAQVYFYIASVFANMAYDGFAQFFTKQGQGELEHANWVSELLISKRIQPQYFLLDAVILPLDVLELAKSALVTELKTTQALKDLYQVCDEAAEFQACALLDKMLLEQIEEEGWATDLVDLVSRTDTTGWLILSEKYGK
jgi:ferritin